MIVQNEPEQQQEPEQPSEPEQPTESEQPTEPEQPSIADVQPTVEPSRPQESRLEKLLANLPPIQMPFNSCTIAPSMRSILDDVASAWNDDKSQKILLTGQSVKQELVNRGVSPAQITTESRGDTEPIAPNTTEENRQKNRRVEIKLVK